jgi:hypothetical protein
MLVMVGVLAVSLTAAACGGSNKPTTTSTTTSTTTKTHTTTPKQAALAVTLRSTTGTAYQGSATASPGDKLLVRTVVPGTASSGTEKVHLAFDKGPSSRLTVTATANGQTSTAFVSGAGSKQVTFAELSYTCALPPAPTFCPPTHQNSTGSAYKVSFSANAGSSVFISALIGPTTIKTPSRTATSTTVPPYLVTAGVRVLPHGGKAKPAPPTSSAVAAPGDLAVLTAHASGRIVGAPQTMTFSFDEGPSNSLTLSARVPGGKVSTATIKGSHGSQISLVLGRYNCLVAPAPTFCPPVTIKPGNRQYTLTFAVNPNTPAIVLLAEVQAG